MSWNSNARLKDVSHQAAKCDNLTVDSRYVENINYSLIVNINNHHEMVRIIFRPNIKFKVNQMKYFWESNYWRLIPSRSNVTFRRHQTILSFVLKRRRKRWPIHWRFPHQSAFARSNWSVHDNQGKPIKLKLNQLLEFHENVHPSDST